MHLFTEEIYHQHTDKEKQTKHKDVLLNLVQGRILYKFFFGSNPIYWFNTQTDKVSKSGYLSKQ